jgi:signal transduction histidine kinase/pSer/pThr/pTyr-binding forkhead associated (FHA) protein
VKEVDLPSLIVIQGPDRGRRIELKGSKAVVGRDIQCDVRLHDTEVSRRHAEFHLVDDAVEIVDLNSSNGTFLNGKRVARQTLQHGDRLLLGRTEMLVAQLKSTETQPVDPAATIDLVNRSSPAEGSAFFHAIKRSEGSRVFLQSEKTGSLWLRDALISLSVMYEASQAVSRIGDVDQLLAHILELTFRSVNADRGCIVLRDPETGRLRPQAVRTADPLLASERLRLSRTIIDYVLKNDEGVLTVDAAADERFGASQSVAQLGIREAMCAPLRGRHETLGVLYVDVQSDRKKLLTTGQPSRFTEDHLKLLIAIAQQAGLAVEDNRLHQAVTQAERLAAIGQTIAAISHHIKNVLQGVRSANDLVEMGLHDSNMKLVEQGWKVVRRNQDRIYKLVMDMLTYSKERTPDLALGDLNAVVADVVELMKPRAAETGCELRLQTDDALPNAWFDAEALHRAVLNLVGNALDAVEGRDAPRVAVSTGLNPDEKRFEIQVVDNGEGVDPDEQESIFQVFVSTKGSRGTGLGLPVTRKIMREHDGDVALESVPGKGSTFTLWIPVRD